MADDASLPVLKPTAERREAAVEKLTQAFASGRIEMEDLEQRLDLVMHARTIDQLDATLAGLETPHSVSRDSAAAPAPPFRADRPKGSKHTIVFMSASHRRGRWVPAPLHRVTAVLGAARLDLRDAELADGLTEIRISVLMGSVEVIAPPDVDIEVDGWALMGAVDHRDIHPAPLETQRHRVRIHARVLMGAVEVKVRDRKEPTTRSIDKTRAD
jgi:hypothetical protein